MLVDDNAGVLIKYLNGDGVDNKLRAATGNDVKYFLADHLGSTNGLTDSSSNLTASTSYDSFGNSTNGNFPSRSPPLPRNIFKGQQAGQALFGHRVDYLYFVRKGLERIELERKRDVFALQSFCSGP